MRMDCIASKWDSWMVFRSWDMMVFLPKEGVILMYIHIKLVAAASGSLLFDTLPGEDAVDLQRTCIKVA